MMTSKSKILKYRIAEKSIAFGCLVPEEEYCSDTDNNGVAALFDRFLLELSGDRKIFFHGYDLPTSGEEAPFDPEVILERAEVITEPLESFFWLEKAKVRSVNFGQAREAELYYFDPKVKWTDFLASAFKLRHAKLVERGILSAYFSFDLHGGADFHLMCDKAYEDRVRELFRRLEDLGYEAKRSIWV